MKKIFLWGGLIGTAVFMLIMFLAGAMSNGKPILPIVYGTNQVVWLFWAAVCAVFFIIGLVMVIIGAVKEHR